MCTEVLVGFGAWVLKNEGGDWEMMKILFVALASWLGTGALL